MAAQNDFSFLPFGAGGIPANENAGTSLPAPRWYQGTAAPTSGNYYNVGDIVYNATPSASTNLAQMTVGWICTTAGAGGTAVFTTIYSNAVLGTGDSLTTTATSGTLAGYYSITLLNPATTGTYSLPEALNNVNGRVVRFKNIASGSVTLTPLGTDSYADAAAITLAQFAVVNLESVGTSVWYKAA